MGLHLDGGPDGPASPYANKVIINTLTANRSIQGDIMHLADTLGSLARTGFRSNCFGLIVILVVGIRIICILRPVPHRSRMTGAMRLGFEPSFCRFKL